MAIAKFYIDDIQQIANVFNHERDITLARPPEMFFQVEGTFRNIQSIRLLEGDSYDGDYTPIYTTRVNTGTKYIIAENLSDDFLTSKWYRLEYLAPPNEDGTEDLIARTNGVVPEVLAEIVDDTRSWLGDTDTDSPAWTDKEYVQAIRFALKQYKGEENLTFISDDDVVPIQHLVRENFSMAIAYDHAKYYALQAPTASLDKSQIMSHYLEVVSGLREQYNAYSTRLNLNSGGYNDCLLYTSPSPRDRQKSRMPSSA